MTSESFQRLIIQHYGSHGRHELPWRQPEANGQFDPYKVLVSEVMLQQTQVPRVIPKFQEFVHKFPTVQVLSEASLGAVLAAWSGLGYNRRAKFLWQTAQIVQRTHGGAIPAFKEQLVRLPGIGPNTAGAILTYAYNQPHLFVETNVRSVFIHHFFPDAEKVTDAQIIEVLQRTLPVGNHREWYWALMDYGTHLKQKEGNPSRRSNTFVKQSKFMGSKRQIRGMVVKILKESRRTEAQLVKRISDDRLADVLEDLLQEGLIVFRNNTFMLP